jgi:sialic acid synthase SpsE
MGFLSPKVKKFNFEVGLSNHTIGIGAVLAWNMIEEN